MPSQTGYIQDLTFIATAISILVASASMALLWGMLAGKLGGKRLYHRLRPDRSFLFFFVLAEVIYLGYKITVLSAFEPQPSRYYHGAHPARF